MILEKLSYLRFLLLFIVLGCFVLGDIKSMVKFYNNFGKIGLLFILMLLTVLWIKLPILVYSFTLIGYWVTIILDYQLRGINFLIGRKDIIRM